MAALLAAFGLPNDLSFNSTVGQVPIDTSVAFEVAGGPEGVAFRKISSLSDAYMCGGLMLYTEETPRKWVFFVGVYLTWALEGQLLNKVVAMRPYNPYNRFTFRNIPGFNGLEHTKVGGVTYRSTEHLGGEATPNTELYDFFDPLSHVVAVGMMVSADTGYGVSTHASSGKMSDFYGNGIFPGRTVTTKALSFVASHIALPETFEQYMTKVKGAAMSRVPDALKEFYDATYDDVMAAFPGRASFPKVAVPTYWENGVLVTASHREPQTAEYDGVVPWNSIVANQPTAWSKQVYTNGQDWSGASTHVFERKTKTIIRFRAGFTNAASPELPFMDLVDGESTLHEIPSMTGIVNGIKVGVLRNGHVLKRSIKDKLSYADTPSPYTSLAEAVNAHIDPFSHDPVDLPSTTALADAMAAFDGIMTRRETKDIYSTGSLVPMLGAFSDAWDTAAKELAEA